MALQVLSEGRPVVFYIHPREIDPGHPRLPMNLYRQTASYVNLETTEVKLRRLLQDFPMTTFGNIMSDYPRAVETHVA
jgi:hypothetical protein